MADTTPAKADEAPEKPTQVRVATASLLETFVIPGDGTDKKPDLVIDFEGTVMSPAEAKKVLATAQHNHATLIDTPEKG